MPRPLRLYYPGAKYHITSRGNGRQRVFRDVDDYERFLAQLDAARILLSRSDPVVTRGRQTDNR